jgi:hypothetical protein
VRRFEVGVLSVGFQLGVDLPNVFATDFDERGKYDTLGFNHVYNRDRLVFLTRLPAMRGRVNRRITIESSSPVKSKPEGVKPCSTA